MILAFLLAFADFLVAFALILYEAVIEVEPPAVDSNLAAWSALAGVFVPLAIATVNQQHWPQRWKAIGAFAVCVAAAVITTHLEGKLDFGHLVESLLIVFTVARVSFSGFWEPLGTYRAIERKTTITDPPAP